MPRRLPYRKEWMGAYIMERNSKINFYKKRAQQMPTLQHFVTACNGNLMTVVILWVMFHLLICIICASCCFPNVELWFDKFTTERRTVFDAITQVGMDANLIVHEFPGKKKNLCYVYYWSEELYVLCSFFLFFFLNFRGFFFKIADIFLSIFFIVEKFLNFLRKFISQAIGISSCFSE